MLKVIRYSALALLLVIAGVWGHAWWTRAPGQGIGDAFAQRLAAIFGQDMPVPSAGGGVQLPPGISLGGPFSLVRQDGVAVTERDFAGQSLLLYFGFTYCPDICPTELGRIADVVDALGPAGQRVTPLFITIDPQRDTPAALADYVGRFHPRMQGLTGSVEQIRDVAARYRVYFQRRDSPDATHYLMDHSSFMYFVGPDARVRTLFRSDASVEEMTRSISGQLRILPSS